MDNLTDRVFSVLRLSRSLLHLFSLGTTPLTLNHTGNTFYHVSMEFLDSYLDLDGILGLYGEYPCIGFLNFSHSNVGVSVIGSIPFSDSQVVVTLTYFVNTHMRWQRCERSERQVPGRSVEALWEK